MANNIIVNRCWLHWLVALLAALVSTCFSDSPYPYDGTLFNGSICAYADFNFDLYTDILVSNDGRISVLLAPNQQVYNFVNDARYITDPIISEKLPGATIASCGVGDFNNDHFPDVIVTLTDGPTTLFHICYGSGPFQPGNFAKYFDCKGVKFEDSNPELISQPLVADVNGDGITDIVAVVRDGKDGKDGAVRCWKHAEVEKNGYLKLCGIGMPFENAVDGGRAHSFVDLDGDLNPELLLVVKNESTHGRSDLISYSSHKVEGKTEWIRTQRNGAPLIPPIESITSTGSSGKLFNGKLPSSKQEWESMWNPTLADFDSDGAIDIMLPFLTDDGNLDLFIWVNLRGIWISRSLSLSASSTKPKGDFLRVGDYDLNGYVDLVGVFGSNANLVLNVPCTSSGGDQHCADDEFPRMFIVDSTHQFNAASGVNLTTFFDVFEDGNLDVAVQYSEAGANRRFQFIPAADKGDTTFLKATVGTIGSPLDRLYGGVAAPGATMWFETEDSVGRMIRGAHSQLSQSTHHALQLPFALFGLGRSPNFVQSLLAGVPHSPPIRNGSWHQIVPNARLYLIPTNEGEWISRLFLTPSRLILLSVAALGAICFVIIVFIAALHWRERREDQIERQRDSHKFHFDAM